MSTKEEKNDKFYIHRTLPNKSEQSLWDATISCSQSRIIWHKMETHCLSVPLLIWWFCLHGTIYLFFHWLSHQKTAAIWATTWHWSVLLQFTLKLFETKFCWAPLQWAQVQSLTLVSTKANIKWLRVPITYMHENQPEGKVQANINNKILKTIPAIVTVWFFLTCSFSMFWGSQDQTCQTKTCKLNPTLMFQNKCYNLSEDDRLQMPPDQNESWASLWWNWPI